MTLVLAYIMLWIAAINAAFLFVGDGSLNWMSAAAAVVSFGTFLALLVKHYAEGER